MEKRLNFKFFASLILMILGTIGFLLVYLLRLSDGKIKKKKR